MLSTTVHQCTQYIYAPYPMFNVSNCLHKVKTEDKEEKKPSEPNVKTTAYYKNKLDVYA